jgi:tRNA pseudouridine38-40 synthase
VLFAYVGLNYGGLQRNPGQVTIESILFSALEKAGLIEPGSSFEDVMWQSCARTDKGVSALGNVISLKIFSFRPDFGPKINEYLPEDIRVINVRKVGKKFNPKNRCDSRRYSYVLPTKLFAPGPHSQNKNKTPVESFKFDSSMVSRVNSVFKYYEGTHNYHNFTAKGGPKTHDNASAARYILSTNCGEPFMIGDEEWVEITFIGQSFIIYQIRKMVALGLSIVRDEANPRIILSCFEKPKKILPTAPALGLFLNRCNFEEFSKIAGLKLIWSEEEEKKMNDYMYSQVIPTIAKYNNQNETFAKWIETHDQFPLNYEELYCTVEGEYNFIKTNRPDDVSEEEIRDD